MPTKIFRVVAPIVVLAASFGAYTVLQNSKPVPQQSDDGPRPISVYTATVEQRSTALVVEAQGEVRARTHINIVSQVGGRIVRVSPEFTEGGRIEPGISLLKIEESDYLLALGQAEARVAEAEVRVQQALADADVARKQLRNDLTASDLALKKPQVAEARARLKGAAADLEQAKLYLSRTDITLPFAGRLIDTKVDVGQYIVPGTTLGSAFATDIVEIRLPLNNSQLASLGLPIGYTAPQGKGLPVTFHANVAGKQQQWHGSLVRLDASIDPSTRLIYGMAEVVDPYHRNVSNNGMPLAVGLYVDAQISGRYIEQALSIPRSALRAGNMVLLIDDQGSLQTRKVEVTHAGSQYIIISSGLTVGERVITSAIRNPIPGMPLVAVDQ